MPRRRRIHLGLPDQEHAYEAERALAVGLRGIEAAQERIDVGQCFGAITQFGFAYYHIGRAEAHLENIPRVPHLADELQRAEAKLRLMSFKSCKVRRR